MFFSITARRKMMIKNRCLFNDSINLILDLLIHDVRSCHAKRQTTNPPADFVVVKIHQHSTQPRRVPGEVDFLFGHVYELVGELVPVVRVVSAAAPQPVRSYGFLGAGLFTAAASCKFPVATRSADGVHQPSCHQCVNKGRFPCGY